MDEVVHLYDKSKYLISLWVRLSIVVWLDLYLLSYCKFWILLDGWKYKIFNMTTVYIFKIYNMTQSTVHIN